MTTVYRVTVSPVITGWGLMHHEKVGTLHELAGGTRTVIDGNGGQPPEGWHTSRRDAYLEAAEYVQAIVAKLHGQVDRFMVEAAK